MAKKYKNSKPHTWRLHTKADQITFSHWQRADTEVDCASVTVGNDIERGCACEWRGEGGSRLKAIAWELTALAEGWTWMGLKQCGHMPRETDVTAVTYKSPAPVTSAQKCDWDVQSLVLIIIKHGTESEVPHYQVFGVELPSEHWTDGRHWKS